MRFKKSEVPILLVNLIYILAFGSLSLLRLNYEFVIYCAVIVLFLLLICVFQRRIQFDCCTLWGLTLWGFLHMAGGHLFIGGTRLYDQILLPVWSKYGILKYDQFVHVLGFGVATLVCFHLLRPHLKAEVRSWAVLSVLAALMGMGLGAFNEVIELLVVWVVPQSGVGG